MITNLLKVAGLTVGLLFIAGMWAALVALIMMKISLPSSVLGFVIFLIIVIGSCHVGWTGRLMAKDINWQ